MSEQNQADIEELLRLKKEINKDRGSQARENFGEAANQYSWQERVAQASTPEGEEDGLKRRTEERAGSDKSNQRVFAENLPDQVRNNEGIHNYNMKRLSSRLRGVMDFDTFHAIISDYATKAEEDAYQIGLDYERWLDAQPNAEKTNLISDFMELWPRMVTPKPSEEPAAQPVEAQPEPARTAAEMPVMSAQEPQDDPEPSFSNETSEAPQSLSFSQLYEKAKEVTPGVEQDAFIDQLRSKAITVLKNSPSDLAVFASHISDFEKYQRLASDVRQDIVFDRRGRGPANYDERNTQIGLSLDKLVVLLALYKQALALGPQLHSDLNTDQGRDVLLHVHLLRHAVAEVNKNQGDIEALSLKDLIAAHPEIQQAKPEQTKKRTTSWLGDRFGRVMTPNSLPGSH